MKRATLTETIALDAECTECPWRTDAGNGLGNAARHHDATGHQVATVITRRITYGSPHRQSDEQTSIYDQLQP